MEQFDPQRLRRIREARGLTRTNLASQAGRSEQTFFLYEGGKVIPPIPVLQRIADALGCRVADFFTDQADDVAA